ncbi:MAG: YbjQ family protein [Beijerinckiaceae bacterium]|nr:YbjQ family protein [Beijerinckiaceae bacterium]
MMVSTTSEIIGFKTVRHLGIVRGITVRSRSVVGNFVGGIQSLFGGQISAYVELAESARQEAFTHMCEHAAQAGANAIVGMRYDANDIMDGITEVLAYGTAVWVEPVSA